MKRLGQIGMVLGIVVAMSSISMPAIAAEMVEHTIAVTGNGTGSAMPDHAKMNVDVQSNADKAQQAQTENTQKAAALKDALLAAGVAEEDIVSGTYWVSPNYIYKDTGEQVLTGYEAYQRFQVTTDEVDHVGELLQAAVKAGAYVDGSVSFYVEDTNALYHQALTAAVQNARVTANQTAQALGVTVSGIHSVVVEPSYQSYTVYGNSAMATAEESVADGAAAPEISYDDVEVDASVQILFQY